MLWTTETTIFVRVIARVFIQRKQPYLWFIANNGRNISWGHNADNYFLNLSWNIHSYVYLIILLTLEEEYKQFFRQLSVEFLVRSIHFVHFIHLSMNLLSVDLCDRKTEEDKTNLVLWIDFDKILKILNGDEKCKRS